MLRSGPRIHLKSAEIYRHLLGAVDGHDRDARGLGAGEEMRRRPERRDHGLLRRKSDGVATTFEMFGKLAVGLSSSPVMAWSRSRNSISDQPPIGVLLLGDDPVNAGPKLLLAHPARHEVSSRSCY
jgi:hypothetical protein